MALTASLRQLQATGPICSHLQISPKRQQRCVSSRAAVPSCCTGRRDQTTDQKPTAKYKFQVGLEDLLGPIGLSLQALRPSKDRRAAEQEQQQTEQASTSGRDSKTPAHQQNGAAPDGSIHSLTTEEWRARYEAEGGVDLWVEEEFNSGSRLKGGRDAHKGSVPGFGSGEGQSAGTAQRHAVTIHNPMGGQTVHVDVPEDRYILWEAEDKGLLLPYACRMGCCTACAVKVKSGEMHQPQSLGVSREMQAAGYGLMCVGYAKSDLELELVEEDEVYDQQFGQYFAQLATDPNNRASIARDDFALELADMDE